MLEELNDSDIDQGPDYCSVCGMPKYEQGVTVRKGFCCSSHGEW